MTSYYLIRHGVTDWIEAGITQGISDRPLSPLGMEQARLTGQALKDSKAVKLYTSPMLRARQTAQPISSTTGLKPEILDDLLERDQGWLEGKRDIWRMLKGKKILLSLWQPLYIAITSLTGVAYPAFHKRVLAAWKHIRSQETDQPVIIVAHSGVLNTILRYELSHDLKGFMKISTATCSISVIAFDEEGHARPVRLNDTSHLNGRAWG